MKRGRMAHPFRPCDKRNNATNHLRSLRQFDLCKQRVRGVMTLCKYTQVRRQLTTKA